MSGEPKAGARASVKATVGTTRTAAALAADGERLPEVFATPFMIADMERACAAILAPHLPPERLSVGARIEVRHLAPTAPGDAVTATARFTGREGALYWFDVWAEDSAGRIGEGRIARAVVDAGKLAAGARARRG